MINTLPFHFFIWASFYIKAAASRAEAAAFLFLLLFYLEALGFALESRFVKLRFYAQYSEREHYFKREQNVRPHPEAIVHGKAHDYIRRVQQRKENAKQAVGRYLDRAAAAV